MGCIIGIVEFIRFENNEIVTEFDLKAGTLNTVRSADGGDYLDVSEERGSNFTEEVCKVLERAVTA